MSTVVLLGFSTAGKSTILSDFETKYPQLQTIDTDQRIARDHRGHIYQVYLDLVSGSDRQPALDYIDEKERVILKSIQVSAGPRLIAAGPFLPLRNPEWDDFLGRVHPLCLHLDLDPSDVYDGLISRRCEHLKDQAIVNHPAAGSWDEGVTTEYQHGKWVDVPREKALENISKLMQGPFSVYKKYSGGRDFNAIDIRKDPAAKDRFYEIVKDGLGL
jgi:shikimate kinase